MMALQHVRGPPGIPLGKVLHNLSPHYHIQTSREPFSINLIEKRDEYTMNLSRYTAPSLPPIRTSAYDDLTTWVLPRSPLNVFVSLLFELGLFSMRARSPERDRHYCISRVAYAPNSTLRPSGTFIASSLRQGDLRTFWDVDFHSVSLIRLPDEVAHSTARSDVCTSVQ